MTDKELQEWEKEAKEANQDIKHIIKIVIIGGLIILTLYLIS
tara:strand:- start:95 stop:220 length:126 start_codon:yes stop_codon:yes gene_type:complete